MNLLFILNDIFLFIVLFWFSILIHELGHLSVAESYGAKPYLKFSRYSFEVHFNEEGLSNKQKRLIYEGGVLSGLPVVLISLLVIPYLFPALFIIYFMGCRYDLQQIKHLK